MKWCKFQIEIKIYKKFRLKDKSLYKAKCKNNNKKRLCNIY